jgi:hypothetical protein
LPDIQILDLHHPTDGLPRGLQSSDDAAWCCSMEVCSQGRRWRPHMVTALRLAAFVSVALTLPSACTSHRAYEPNAKRDVASEQEPPLEPLATPTVSANENEPAAWRWIHRGGEGGWSADIGPKSIRAGSFVCAFTHDDRAHDAGKVCCEAPGKRWCAEMREDFVPGIALASDGQRLFIADYPAISSGARFAAHELETGAMLWSREALAIGPQGHSEYFNVVQLRRLGDVLIAYGDEAHGAYVEAMDPETGAVLEHHTLERPQVQWSWSDAEPEPEAKSELALAGGGTCRFESDERAEATLTCAPVGANAWTRELEGDFVGRGALASDGRHVVLVTWSRIANGAHARAWTLADGALGWERELEGIGPQDHSKYSNLIQLDLEDGLVIVRGLEAHGRYVEAIDVASGSLRWTVSWPAF